MRSIEDIKIALNVAKTDEAHRALTNILLLELWAAFEDLQKNLTISRTESDEKKPPRTSYRSIDYQVSIMDLPLSTRTKKCLASAGITCLNDLEGWTAYDLDSIRNMGLLCIRELGAYMAEKGMQLPGLDTIKRRS